MVEKFDELENSTTTGADNSEQNSEADMGDKTMRACACVAILALMLAVAALSLVVIIIAKPSILIPDIADISDSNEESNTAQSQSEDSSTMIQAMEEKTWVFAYDVPWGERNKIEDSGALGGLSVEIYRAVCAEAGMRCKHVVTPIKYCWDGVEGIGEGLLNGWFDACAMYITTPQRANIFGFSGEFYKAKKGQFYQLSSNSHQVTQLASLKVGVAQGWFTDETCLNRNGLTADSVVITDPVGLVTKLNDGSIDLAFVEEGFLDSEAGLSTLSETQECALKGNGAMHRQDSALPLWFEDAAERVKTSGQLSTICARYPTITNCNID